MIRLSKFADYGIVLLTYMANGKDDSPQTARHLSELAELPLPTVSKILKAFSRAGLLVSHRGKQGGYSLAREPTKISVAQMISAIEGPIAMTECSSHAPGLCAMEQRCPVRGNWRRINEAVRLALDGLTLAVMTTPLAPDFAKHGAVLELIRGT